MKEAPLAAGAKKEQVMEKLAAPKEILAIEYEKPPKEVEEKPESPEPPVKVEAEAEKPVPVEKLPDLLVFFPFANYNLGPFFFLFLGFDADFSTFSRYSLWMIQLQRSLNLKRIMLWLWLLSLLAVKTNFNIVQKCYHQYMCLPSLITYICFFQLSNQFLQLISQMGILLGGNWHL